MKNIITAIIMILMCSGLLGYNEPPLSIGSVSFKDAVWDNSDNILYSKQKIGSLTEENKAVVLYLFEICFT